MFHGIKAGGGDLNIHTGLYVPGTAFQELQVKSIVASQRPAILKGAYHSAEGVKQRVIIVDNEEVKAELKKLLLKPSTFKCGELGGDPIIDDYVRVIAVHGKELALSGRIITLAQRKQDFINLKKLYVDTLTCGFSSPNFCTTRHKKPTFMVAAVTGFAVGGLIGVISTSSLGVGFGLLAFIGRAIHQKLKPEIEAVESSWKDLCRLFDEHGLHCKDIRLLGHRTGDRAYLRDITSASDRKRARSCTSGARAQDEQLATFLRASPRKAMYEKVSGYQGDIVLLETATV